MILSLGIPPTPKHWSSEIEPVGMVSTFSYFGPIVRIESLPNFLEREDAIRSISGIPVIFLVAIIPLVLVV